MHALKLPGASCPGPPAGTDGQRALRHTDMLPRYVCSYKCVDGVVVEVGGTLVHALRVPGARCPGPLAGTDG